MPTRTKTIRVKTLARVEGEGSMTVNIRDGVVRNVELGIYEPPRFFEALLRGRKFTEAPDITSRICGICPIAYQLSSIQAMEGICGVTVDEPIRQLRRLMMCGEWIESHALHIFMLHAPDFLGYQDVVEMAKEHGDLVRQALRLKKIGNAIVTTIGGREIHPVTMKVGGFWSVPTRDKLADLLPDLQWALKFAVETVKLVDSLPFQAFERDYRFVSLEDEAGYPLQGSHIVTSVGLRVPLADFASHFAEDHVAHSNALHGRLTDGGAYHVGPLARFALHAARLTPEARAAARSIGLVGPVRNPFMSIKVRAVEAVFAVEEALRIVGEYRPPESPCAEIRPRAGVGYGCCEAPRGICFHRYEIDDEGLILSADIRPPTSQNLPTIEEDLREFVGANLDLGDDELQRQCEQAVRNYDPCISCATHFLKLNIVRE